MICFKILHRSGGGRNEKQRKNKGIGGTSVTKFSGCGFPVVGIGVLGLNFSSVVCIVNTLPASDVLCM